MTMTCACGATFPNVKELRVHIALETERWPLQPCSPEHHDPHNPQDLRLLRWLDTATTWTKVDEAQS